MLKGTPGEEDLQAVSIEMEYKYRLTAVFLVCGWAFFLFLFKSAFQSLKNTPVSGAGLSLVICCVCDIMNCANACSRSVPYLTHQTFSAFISEEQTIMVVPRGTRVPDGTIA